MITREQVKVSAQVPPNFKEVCTLRIKESKFSVSAQGKGNPQIVWNCEIVKPLEHKATDGKTYALDALELTFYFATKVFKDGQPDVEATAKAQDKLLTVHEKLDLPAEFDPENPNIKIYDGLMFDMILSSMEDIPQRRNPVTGAYEAMKGGDGKPIKKGYKFLTNSADILNRATVETNRPY